MCLVMPNSRFKKLVKESLKDTMPIQKRQSANEKGGRMKEDDMPSPYCPICEHCGEIGCCGVATFLEHHVRGKTDCMYEDEIIDEIEEWFEMKKEEE